MLTALRTFLFIATFCFSFSQQQLMALTASVAVPCYYKHFHYLPQLLTSLAAQSQLPDSVVVSLSQVEMMPEADIDALEAITWPFELKIIRREGVFMEGSNRTRAALECTSDIVLCIDADDIPHAQRIEAVVQLFEAEPDAVMVLCGHAYCPGNAIVCEKAIPFFTPEEYEQVHFSLGSHTWKHLQHAEDLCDWPSGVHNGAPSIKRSALDDGSYWTDRKNGADLEFNQMILRKHQQTYLIKLPLLHYFNARSSGADIGR
jgi:glycosyltransferase involved in cell wall biosynthesis